MMAHIVHTYPPPYYGLRKKCVLCDRGFWKEDNYREHYVWAHTDGLKYKITDDGLHAVERI